MSLFRSGWGQLATVEATVDINNLQDENWHSKELETTRPAMSGDARKQ